MLILNINFYKHYFYNKLISLKWKNKTSITRGLEQTVNWYIKNIDYFKSIKKRDITKRLGLK